MGAIVEVADLHFAYGDNTVLGGVDLSVDRGEILVMLGPNGAGKTTLVENLVGTLKPQRGTVRIFGGDPARPGADFWPRTALIQQNWGDHSKWRVRDFLTWQRELYLSAGRQVRQVDEALDNVGLSDKAGQTLGKLSGGQRRRIDFAAAQLAQPELYILDEPSTGLDPAARAQIHEQISAVADDGAAILMTTHDLAEAEKLASRIVILSDGLIAARGSAHELRGRLAGKAQVTWVDEGITQVHATDQVEAFVKTLDLDRISELTITRPTLEDVYLNLVTKTEEK